MTILAVVGCDAGSSRPRNVLMVCLDTVRFDTFWLPERSGGADAFSPWAEKAIRFQHALAPAPWTLPSVASILTGRYPNAHGAGVYGDAGGNLHQDVPPALSDEVATLPELLAARGYRVQGFVAQKFFAPSFGLRRGFEGFAQHPKAAAIFAGAERWLAEHQQRRADEPFFLYLHFLEAHREHMQSSEILTRRSRKFPTPVREAAIAAAPAGICADPEAQLCLAFQSYVHAVWKLRRGMAGMLEQLEARGLLETTIVVVYSDHGEEFHDHREPQRARGTDVREIYGFGHGQSLYQELLHVPLLVWHPDRPGQDVEVDVSLVDVVPTLLDWLGIEAPDTEWDGISLADPARLDGPRDGARPVFASEVAFGPREFAVVSGRWKRVLRTAPEERELFDLAADPGEREGLEPGAAAAETARLDALIAAYAAAARGSARPSAELDAAELEALQALGYVEQAEVE